MKAKILIIEDDENISRNLVILFSSLEYEVSSVISAETALEEMSSELPDLIICDINLPQMSGYELKQKLNEDKNAFNIPFIFLTARNTYEDLRKGMKLAADDYIFKPFHAQDIIESVEIRLLKQKLKSDKEKDSHIFVKVNKSIKKISIKNINLILSENQYSRIHQISGKNYLIRKPLNKWEQILPENFKRVNRSAIVDLKKIIEIEKRSNHKFLHIEGTDERIKVTDSKIIEQLLNEK